MMNKNCGFKECTEKIFSWQEFCYKHNNQEETQMNNQQQPTYPAQPNWKNPAQVIDGNGNTFQSQNPQPMQQQPMPPPPQRQPMSVPKPPSSPELPKMVLDNDKSKFEISGEIPTLTEPQRLVIKQTAFKRAVDVIIQSGEIEEMSYDKLKGKLQRMTVDFYNIVVSKNENK